MSDPLTSLFIAEADRVRNEMLWCLQNGFEIMTCFDKPPGPRDETRIYGFTVLIKRYDK